MAGAGSTPAAPHREKHEEEDRVSDVLEQNAKQIADARVALRRYESEEGAYWAVIIALADEVERLEAIVGIKAARIAEEQAKVAELLHEMWVGQVETDPDWARALTPEHRVDDLSLNEKPCEPECPAPETEPVEAELTALPSYQALCERVAALEAAKCRHETYGHY